MVRKKHKNPIRYLCTKFKVSFYLRGNELNGDVELVSFCCCCCENDDDSEGDKTGGGGNWMKNTAFYVKVTTSLKFLVLLGSTVERQSIGGVAI